MANFDPVRREKAVGVIQSAEFREFAGSLAEIAARLPEDIEKILYENMAAIHKTMAHSIQSGPKTGRIYGSKRAVGAAVGGFLRGKKEKLQRRKRLGKSAKLKWHQASAPGEAPATDKGQLVSSLTFEVARLQGEVGATVGAPYAKWLEEGTKPDDKGGRRLLPRPFLMPAVNKQLPEINNQILGTILDALEDRKKSWGRA